VDASSDFFRAANGFSVSKTIVIPRLFEPVNKPPVVLQPNQLIGLIIATPSKMQSQFKASHFLTSQPD
jgi:hypothetical protein